MCKFAHDRKTLIIMLAVVTVNINLLITSLDSIFFLDILYFFNNFWQVVQKYKLGNPRTFHYLNQTNCYELEGVDEFKEYCDTRRAMDVVGISFEEQVFHRELL